MIDDDDEAVLLWAA